MSDDTHRTRVAGFIRDLDAPMRVLPETVFPLQTEHRGPTAARPWTYFPEQSTAFTQLRDRAVQEWSDRDAAALEERLRYLCDLDPPMPFLGVMLGKLDPTRVRPMLQIEGVTRAMFEEAVRQCREALGYAPHEDAPAIILREDGRWCTPTGGRP